MARMHATTTHELINKFSVLFCFPALIHHLCPSSPHLRIGFPESTRHVFPPRANGSASRRLFKVKRDLAHVPSESFQLAGMRALPGGLGSGVCAVPVSAVCKRCVLIIWWREEVFGELTGADSAYVALHFENITMGYRMKTSI